MATLKIAIPGIGGSLGECAVCGQTFLSEILLGQAVDSLRLDICEKDLPVHTKCAELVIAMQGKWADVRDKFPDGPLKRAYDEMQAEKELSPQSGKDTR